jgi:FtsZ-binding cell division protein ZapB
VDDQTYYEGADLIHMKEEDITALERLGYESRINDANNEYRRLAKELEDTRKSESNLRSELNRLLRENDHLRVELRAYKDMLDNVLGRLDSRTY